MSNTTQPVPSKKTPSQILEKPEKLKLSVEFESDPHPDEVNRENECHPDPKVRCFKCGSFGHTGVDCERKRRDESNSDSNFGSDFPFEEQKCWQCGCLGHLAIHCTRKDVICFSCGKYGHKQKECRSPMSHCWNCGKKGHIKRNCELKDNVGMCFNCHEVGHHSRNCHNRRCHLCQVVGHVMKDCPNKARLLKPAYLSDSQTIPQKRKQKNQKKKTSFLIEDSRRSCLQGVPVSEDDSIASEPTYRNPTFSPFSESGFCRNFIGPPQPNVSYHHTICNTTQQPQQIMYDPNMQTLFMHCSTRREHPSPHQREYAEPPQLTLDKRRHTQEDVSGASFQPISINMPVAGMDSFEEDLHSMDGSSCEGDIEDHSERETQNKKETNHSLASRDGTEVASFSDMHPTDYEEFLWRKKKNQNKPFPKSIGTKSREIGDTVIAEENGEHWLGTIIGYDCEEKIFNVQIMSNDKKTQTKNFTASQFLNPEEDTIPTVINQMKVQNKSDLEYLRGYISNPNNKDCDSETEEEEWGSIVIVPDVDEKSDPEMPMDLPDTEEEHVNHSFSDQEQASMCGNLPMSPTSSPQTDDFNQKRAACSGEFEGEEHSVYFKLDQDFVNSYRNRNPDYGFGTLGEIVYLQQIQSKLGEEWFEVCHRAVEFIMETQRRRKLELKLKYKPEKAQKRGQELYDHIFSMKVLPSAKFLKFARKSYEWGKVNSMSLFDTGFVSTRMRNGWSPGRPFRFLMDCFINAVDIGYDLRIMEGVAGVKFQIQRPTGDWKSILIHSTNDWGGYIEQLINSYLVRGYNEPKALCSTSVSNDELKYLENIHRRIKYIFDCNLWKTIDPRIVLRIVDTLKSAFQNYSSLAVITQDNHEVMRYPNGSQPTVIKAGRLIELKTTKANDYEQLLWREFQRVGTDRVSIVWKDNIKKVGRFRDERIGQTIKNINVQGLNPECDMALESYELAPKVEIVLPRCKDMKTFLFATKYAVIVSKTLNLLSVDNWPETNQKLRSNSRTGVGLCGVTSFLSNYGDSYSTLKTWCLEGYRTVKTRNKSFSNEFKCMTSKTSTSINTTPQLSLLAGSPPGMGYIFSRYSRRLIEVAPHLKDSLEKQGYRVHAVHGDITVLEFVAENLGIDLAEDGRVEYVAQMRQASIKGVQVGWTLLYINNQPYSEQTLKETFNASKDGGSFLLTFNKTREDVLSTSKAQQVHYIAEIPVDAGPYCSKSLYDVPLCIQIGLCAFLSEHWADNAVSAVIPFNSNTEEQQLPCLLEQNQFKLKSVTLWRHQGAPKDSEVDGQMSDYKVIGKDEYDELMKDVRSRRDSMNSQHLR